jgi:hypothetical protein
MDTIDLILIAILPSVVVFLTCFLLIKRYLEHIEKKSAVDHSFELKKESIKTILPLRLQAYERVILYLERISPNSLVMRTYKAGMSARLLQAELIKAIRDEYEHNMTQQVYVSANSWAMVRNAKEEMVKLINISAGHLTVEASAIDLSQRILENASRIDKLPTDLAITYAKSEIHKMF